MASIGKVLVVEDEEKIVEIVQSYLAKAGYEVVTARTGADALLAVREQQISVMLLDLMLPDISGEDICREIRKTSGMPILMMTARVDEESIIQGLQIGADDYITKPFSPRQLVARVGAVLRRQGGVVAQKTCLTYKELCVCEDTWTVEKAGRAVALTPNEFKILALLMSRPQKVFTRDEIIARIKDNEYDGFDRSIDSHIKNLRQKIEDDPKNPVYIVTVYGVGYRLGKE